MCLALIAFAAHPRYRVVVAANRDEYHARPAAPAAWWDEGFLAGRDLKAGGTWLGVDRRGRFALLTNVREPARHDPAAPSRGALVPNVAHRRRVAVGVAPGASARRRSHNGFNLIAGDSGELLWGSNRAVAAAQRSAPASTAFRITCWIRRGPRWCARRQRFDAGAKATATRTISPRSFDALARHRAGSRRRAAGDRRHARTGTDAFGAVHHRRRTTARAARPS